MKYSKSLDLILAALTFGSSGKIEKAAACFDKALTMKDLSPTVAALEKQQAEAHTVLIASLTKPVKKTTAQLMAALAAKRKATAAEAKKPFPGAAPPFKKKTEAEGDDEQDESEDEDDEEETATSFENMSEDRKARYLLNRPKSKYHKKPKKTVKKKAKAALGDDEEEEDEGRNGPESFGDIADDMTKASNRAQAADDEEDEDLDLDSLNEDEVEAPEASVEDVEDGFNDRMEETEPGVPSADGEGQPGEGFTETSEDESEDEDEDEDDEEETATSFKDMTEDRKARYLLNRPNSKYHKGPGVKKKKKTVKSSVDTSEALARMKRVQANVQAMSCMSKLK